MAGNAETPCGFLRNRGGTPCNTLQEMGGVRWRESSGNQQLPPPMAQLDEEAALLPLVLDAQTNEQAAQILDALAILAAAEDQQLLLLVLDDLGDGCEPIEPAPSRMKDT